MIDMFTGLAYSIAGCGLLALCIGLLTSLREWWFLRNAIVTTGTIVTSTENEHPETGTFYEYAIRFKTRTEQEQQVTFKNRHVWEVGHELQLSYQPAKPEKAILKNERPSRIPGLTSSTLWGGTLLLLGLILLYASETLF